jgi:protein-histidine pros-kinase
MSGRGSRTSGPASGDSDAAPAERRGAHGSRSGSRDSAGLVDLGDSPQQSALFSGLLESAPDPILGIDAAGRIVFANAQTERLFGYGRAELQGQPVELLVPERFRGQHGRQRAGYGLAPATRPMGAGLDLWARRRDGTEFPVEISLSPMAEPAGQLIIAIVRDVTEQKCALEGIRERERKFRAIFNSTFQFIALLAPDGLVLDANHASLELAEVSENEMVGRPVWETAWCVHSPELQGRLKEAVAAAAGGDFVRFEASHPRAAAVDASIKPVRDEAGRVILLVAEGRDITDRKRAELERENLLTLAEEARARAEESLASRQKAEQMKDDLTNMVVHDLKNPVSGITMMIQAALRRSHDLPPRLRDTLLQIDRSCREMLRLVQNVLEIGKIEEGKMPVVREAVMLADVVDQVVREYAPLAEHSGKRLLVGMGSDLPAIAADHGILKRVLVNLVVNALRHSGSHEVRVETAPSSDDGELVIRVVDHGRGIPEDEQARVFEKFASVRHAPGAEPITDTGLGLPFCKLAVERMGGRIALTSASGGPTVFSVVLPIHATAG